MEDNAIIELYWNRIEDAIRCTSDKYGRYLLKIALNVLNKREDAEECTNDTYLTAWNKIPPNRPNKLLAFLGRITRNIALDRYDYLSAKKRNSQFDVLLSELEQCLPSNNTVESDLDEGEIAASINRFLNKTNEDMRIVFVRRYWFSDSIKDIAERFNISESKVKSMLFRTRNKLRFHLEKEGHTI